MSETALQVQTANTATCLSGCLLDGHRGPAYAHATGSGHVVVYTATTIYAPLSEATQAESEAATKIPWCQALDGGPWRVAIGEHSDTGGCLSGWQGYLCTRADADHQLHQAMVDWHTRRVAAEWVDEP